MALVSTIRKCLQKVAILTYCFIFLNGCSTKVAYNFLDWIMLWYVEKYVNLQDEQKQFAKQSIDAFHQWHRSTQLPRYINYIEGLMLRIDDPATTRSVHEETDRVQLLVEPSFKELLPAIADLSEQFSDKQVVEIQQKLQKERTKYRKKYVDISDKKKQKLRIDELKDYLGKFFGRFTPEQNVWLQRWSESLQPYEELTLKQQQLWANTLNEAMKNRNDRTKLESYLQQLVIYQTDNWQPELQERLDQNQTQTYTLIAKLLNNRTEKQRDHFHKKLNSYLEDLKKLSDHSTISKQGAATDVKAFRNLSAKYAHWAFSQQVKSN